MASMVGWGCLGNEVRKCGTQKGVVWGSAAVWRGGAFGGAGGVVWGAAHGEPFPVSHTTLHPAISASWQNSRVFATPLLTKIAFYSGKA